MAAAHPPEWLILQKKIFTRWVNQKLSLAHGEHKVQVDDCVTGFSDGIALVTLLEVLSGTPFNGPKPKVAKSRVQKLDNLSHVLKFVWDCGVEMELKPSIENIADGEEKQVLGLVWGIMRRFMKFGDDEEQKLKMSDALLMWVKNQVRSYNLDVSSFPKSFQNGVVLCALLHKFRPKLMNYSLVDPKDYEKNIKMMFTVAEKYFGLEPYLTASDIQKLDDKSMVVFVSEFFYGINNRRPWDLAARRITKLVRFTQENDAMRAEYLARSKELHQHVQKVLVLLNDRTIDNNMAGAQKRLEDFNVFRTKDKGEIVSQFLALESLYNHLAIRLVDHARPAFNPGEGLTVKEFSAALAQIEVAEQERNVALNAELNRQRRLVQLNSQHQARSEKLKNWLAQKLQALNVKEEVKSSGAAEFFLNKLSAYRDEEKSIRDTSLVEVKRIGADLLENKYENSADVQAREAEIDAGFAEADRLAAAKKLVLEDDLQRELYKEPIVLLAQQHGVKFEELKGWVGRKTEYLNARETISSISDAKLQLSLLEAFDKEMAETTNTVTALRDVGRRVLEAKYSSQYSSWQYEAPGDIQARHDFVDQAWADLAKASSAKKADLEAALATEIRKEKLRLAFANQAAEFIRWSKDAAEEAASSTFGFTLQEVEAYQAKLDATDASLHQTAQTMRASYTQLYSDLAALGVTENVYTTLTPTELEASYAALEQAIKTRRAAYESELARWRANDALCKKFADLAIAFTDKLKKIKQDITDSKEPLEQQVHIVQSHIAGSDGAQLPELKALQQQIDEAGVSTNPHTGITAIDCAVQFEQYGTFLARKKASLEEEIEHHALHGLTRDQMTEIEAQFKYFDANGNGVLDAFEFKACLYSLGIDRPLKEVRKTMEEYGSRENVTHDGFKKFMIKQLGDTETKEELVQGFKLINYDKEYATEQYLKEILADPDADYICHNAPPVEGGYNYHAWCDDVFSR